MPKNGIIGREENTKGMGNENIRQVRPWKPSIMHIVTRGSWIMDPYNRFNI